MLDFPNSPTVGQVFTVSGATWTWDGVKWAANGMPVVATGDNRIINGDMRINQRGTVSGSTIGYTIDRWQYVGSQAAKISWSQTGPATTPLGFPYAHYCASVSAYASAATDIFEFFQAIEADAISDFAWGSANAQPVTLSFWAWSTLTGTFSGSIFNYGSTTRSYPFSYSLPTASTWTRVVITIPGDTTGAWVMSGNAGSMYLSFDLGSGSTKRGPANAWASAAYIGVTGAVSLVATNGAAFQVTGVKLEIGSVATPYNRQSLAKSMADCQRYYQVVGLQSGGFFTGATGISASVNPAVSPRASATLTILSNTSASVSGVALGHLADSVVVTGTTGTGGYTLIVQVSANAEL